MSGRQVQPLEPEDEEVGPAEGVGQGSAEEEGEVARDREAQDDRLTHALGRHLLEVTVAQVAVEQVGGRAPPPLIEGRPVHHVDVHPPIAVEIEDRDPGAVGVDQVGLVRRAASGESRRLSRSRVSRQAR